MKLTQEEKRIKIAEACGFKREDTPLSRAWYNPDHETCQDGQIIWEVEDLPDYFNDLNAMHEAERILILKGGTSYFAFCVELSKAGLLGEKRIFATAAQRAEAFGLTLGLWKEGE